MINLIFRTYSPLKPVEKNTLYKVIESDTIKFVEHHENTQEIANVEYCLGAGVYGIYANEYRRPGIQKEGCKTTDVLACVVDEKKKEIKTIIFDVKSNISAFSDDLSQSSAMITAIKEVRDFVEQVHAEILHKESFMLYYRDDDYQEEEKVGIVTKSFEKEKFKSVAKKLEKMVSEDKKEVSALAAYKMKNNLRAYKTEIPRLYNFADKKLVINKKVYTLQVFLLEKVGEGAYEATIKI